MDWLSPIRSIFEFALPFLDSMPIVRAVLGFILVFFVPGFAWTLVFFSSKQVNILERSALSVGLSIALVTLSILALNKLVGIRINGLNSFLIIFTITVIPLVFYYFRKLSVRRGDDAA
ncbi:DUF1616 domain-containing protein [Chloroflexota bacterium]